MGVALKVGKVVVSPQVKVVVSPQVMYCTMSLSNALI